MGSTQFAKTSFYLRIAGDSEVFNFHSFSFGLLFATRRVASGRWRGILKFPPRYAKYNSSICPSIHSKINAAVEAFRGRPLLLSLGSFTMTDKKPDDIMLDFMSDLECLEVIVSTNCSFKAAQHAIEKATKCIFLSLEYSHGNVSSTDLVKLPKSNLHTLIISKLVLTQEAFQQLLQCFLTVPCDHPQKLELKAVSVKDISGKVKCNPPNISYWPELEVTEQCKLCPSQDGENQKLYDKNVQASVVLASS